MSISLTQNRFELLRIDDDDVDSVKEPESVGLTQKSKRKKERKRIISSIPDKESPAASKNSEKQDGQIASIDGSRTSPDAGREDDPSTQVHNMVLTTSFSSSFASYFLFW